MGTSRLHHSGDKGHLAASRLQAPPGSSCRDSQSWIPSRHSHPTCPQRIPPQWNPIAAKGNNNALHPPASHLTSNHWSTGPLLPPPLSVRSAPLVLFHCLVSSVLIIYHMHNNTFAIKGWLSQWQRPGIDDKKACSLLPSLRETYSLGGTHICAKVK